MENARMIFLSVCSSSFTRRKGLCLVKANETMEVGGRTPCYQFRKPIQTCPNEHKESLGGAYPKSQLYLSFLIFLLPLGVTQAPTK